MSKIEEFDANHFASTLIKKRKPLDMTMSSLDTLRKEYFLTLSKIIKK